MYDFWLQSYIFSARDSKLFAIFSRECRAINANFVREWPFDTTYELGANP